MRYLFLLILIRPFLISANDVVINKELRPQDYLYRSNGAEFDSILDSNRKIELGIDLSTGVDCGTLNINSTLRSTVDKVLDPSLFGRALEGIQAQAPLLTICYFSPTWCSLAKNFKLNSQFLSQLRLDQCELADSYVDSRVEDYYLERQKCIHKELKSTNGDHEKALSRCSGSDQISGKLANWAGKKYGEKVDVNKLIESSAKWAGLTGKGAKRAVDLVKAFVGDTVLAKGKISVDYGDKNAALSPHEHLTSLKHIQYEELCGNLLNGVVSGNKEIEIFDDYNSEKIKNAINADTNSLDPQSLFYLSTLPPLKRELYCRKLSDAIATSRFSKDMSRSLQILTELQANPNLPKGRIEELQRKRVAFKDAVHMAVALEKESTSPVNAVLSQINREGLIHQSETVSSRLEGSKTRNTRKRLKASYFDCADGVYCKGGE